MSFQHSLFSNYMRLLTILFRVLVEVKVTIYITRLLTILFRVLIEVKVTIYITRTIYGHFSGYKSVEGTNFVIVKSLYSLPLNN
jgi:hypothetical protein